MDPKQFYSEQIITISSQLSHQKKNHNILAFLRGIIFIICSVFIFALIKYFSVPLLLALVISVAIFSYVINKSIKVKRNITYLKLKNKIITNEIESLNNNYSMFYHGKEYMNGKHSYSYDLDIFGEGSLFQYLCRAVTIFGRNILAGKLTKPIKNIADLQLLQKSIQELKSKIDFRHHFQTTGQLYEKSLKKIQNTGGNINNNPFSDWLKQPDLYHKKTLWSYILIIFPILTTLLLIGTIVFSLPSVYVTLIIIMNFGITGSQLKRVNAEHQKVSNRWSEISSYSQLLSIIENETFESEYLNQQKQFIKYGSYSSSKALKQLKNRLKSLDNRLNFLFAILFNGLFLWDIGCIYLIEKWKSKYQKKFQEWLLVIGEFDALSGFANLAYNNPGNCFPEISKSEEFVFDCTNLGHPLLHSAERITNNYSINGLGKIDIITGANMAGKSTFLRSVGVNLVLAMCGSSVCADKINFTPIDIVTSMRTTDSLQKHESYFFAELKRLKYIIEKSKENKGLFIILDEILKGTNSNDKHYGSEEFIKHIMNYLVSGIIATHDIALGEMEKTYPQIIKNKSFEAEIVDDDIVFDFKLKHGICKNMNATFLMKKMDIIPDYSEQKQNIIN